jgi:signal transduction histidine kinase
VQGQWGLLIEQGTYVNHRNLFKEASIEFGMLFQVMVTQGLLEAANAKLKQADEAKTAFVLTLSHDMRSPLGGLQLALDAMQARSQRSSGNGWMWVCTAWSA